MILGLWDKSVTEWRQYHDESVASACQGKNAVVDVHSVGDCRKQPADVIPVDTLGEESNDSEERAGVRPEFLEHRRGQ